MLIDSNIRRLTLIAGLAASLAGAAYAQETLVLSDLESLTGPAQSVGVPQSNAVIFAVDQINKSGGLKVGNKTYQIKLETQDDRSLPTAGVAAVQKMLSYGKPVLMVGSLSSAVTGAYMPIIRDRDDIVNIVLGAAIFASSADKAIFHPRVALTQYTQSTLAFISKQKGVKRVGILTDNKHGGFVSETPVLKKGLAAAGLELVGEEEFSFGATQFGPQITALSRANPDVINIRGFGGDAARAIKQARDLGYKGLIVTSSGIVPKDVTEAQGGAAMVNSRDLFVPLATDLIEGGRNAAKAKAFEDAFQARFNQGSGATGLSAYSGVYILARALQKAGTVDNIPAIRNALADLTVAEVPEILEPIIPQKGGRIFNDHQSYFALVIREWKDGRFAPVGFVE